MSEEKPPYDYNDPNDRPGGVPDVVAPSVQTQAAPAANPSGAPYNYADPNDRPGARADGTTGPQPPVAFWNKPASQSWPDYLVAHLGKQFEGAETALPDAARVIGDTWSIGQMDRGLSRQLTGPALEAERKKTEEARARQGPMRYADDALAAILPGFGSLGIAGRVAGKALPYVNTGVKAVDRTLSKMVGAGTEGGLYSGLQDLGHGITNPLTVAGDVGVGGAVGSSAQGLAEGIAPAIRRVKDWVAGRPSLPAGTPADITATAAPNNPTAATLEHWQANPPSPADVEQFGNARYGARGNWPTELQKIYDAANGPGRVARNIPRFVSNAASAIGQGATYLTGAFSPTAHMIAAAPIQYVADRAGQAAGEALTRSVRGSNVSNAITNAYPGMLGVHSFGPRPTALPDALRRTAIGALATPQ